MKKNLNTVIMQTVCTITQKNQTDILLDQFGKNSGEYILEMTGYTDTVTDQKGQKTIIADGNTRPSTFAASKKIISDYEASNIILENIPPDAVRYYRYKNREFFYELAILIDIKAAYPSVLKNTGIITEETYNLLMRLKKLDRLKAIGMLASEKIKIVFENGRPIRNEKSNEAKYKDLYFFAAYEIGEILHELSQISKEDFLFYWFDGIYIKSNWLYAAEIMKRLNEKGYEFSVSWIKNFEAKKINENLKIRWTEITNSKKDIGKPEEKSLLLPNKPKNEYR
jgi:hypothetical protein